MVEGGRGLPDGVYPAREDTFLLLPFARAGPGSRVLDIGTGAGLASLEAARSGAWVVATDRNLHALAHLRARALDEGLPIRVVRTDLARGLGRFDRVLANPPYLPTPSGPFEDEPGDRLAVDGGPDGTAVTARIVATLAEHLLPQGRAFLLVSTLQSPRAIESTLADWRHRGGSDRVVAHRDLEGERLEILELRAAPTVR